MEYKNFTKEYHAHNLHLYQMDCMDLLKQTPDNYYNLCIVDPPYGIDADTKNNGKNSDRHEKTSLAKINTYKKTNWDNSIPTDKYFYELFRVSKNQIVWGVNYFPFHFLSGGRIYWDKCVTMPTYSDGELAYCSLINSIKAIKIAWHGMIQHDMKNKETRMHPTQKPVQLYKWLLKNYAKEGDMILDTHLGSMSIAIAVHEMNKQGMNLTLTGCELDEDYYNQAMKRVENACLQFSLV